MEVMSLKRHTTAELIRLLAALVLVLAGMAVARPALAIDLADVANPAPSIDLEPYLAGF